MAPPMIAAIGLGSTVAGGALGAIGAYNKGQAEKNMYYYQAGIAEINAGIAKKNSEHARTTGDKAAEKFGIKAGQQAGMIKAAQASSGLDINSGSAKQVQESQAKVAAQDMSQIRENAAKVAWDYTNQEYQYKNQAKLYKMAGDNSEDAGEIGAMSSIIGTVGSVSSKWLQGQQVGLY